MRSKIADERFLKIGSDFRGGKVLAVRPDPKYKDWWVVLRLVKREFVLHFTDGDILQSGDYFTDLQSAVRRFEDK